MAEAAYAYTVKNTVECHKPIIYSHHEPQKFYSIKEVHYFNSIQFGHATKQSYKLINNGTATSLIETLKNERTVITFLQQHEQTVILFLLFHWY